MRLRRFVALIFLTAHVLAAAAAADLADCEKRFAAAPEKESAAECFFNLTFLQESPESPVAERRIAELQRLHPANGWLSLYLGHLRAQEVERAIVLYRSAAQAFAARREARGEILARSSLYRLLVRQGRLNEAGQEARRAASVAGSSGDPELLAMGQILQARYLTAAREDLERAYLLLRRAEEVLFPKGRYFLQRDCLLALANVGFQTGRNAEARDSYRRLADLAHEKKDHFAEATARYNLASSFLEEMAEMPRPGGTREIVSLARQALEAAAEADNREIQAKSQWMLGLLAERVEALRHLEACLETAVPRDQGYCLNALARRLTAIDPGGARQAADRALAIARQAKDPWDMAFAWRERMRVSWAAASRERAVADSRSALDAIEALRDLQTASTSQAGMFSTWAEDYYWLSGRMLEEEDLENAFSVIERMRARSLIDALEAARATPAAALPLRQQRATVLEQISAVQRRLLDPELPQAERAAANRELETLEIEEADLRDRLTRADTSFIALRRREFATLDRMRQALAPDQALLSFQISPWQDARGDFAGGSWLIVSTRAGSRVYRLPGRVELRPAVRLFTGMFERRDGSETGPSVHLYRQLLEKAVAELPPGTRRLILVPDDVLHQLPFAALRPSPEAPPLASRYELSRVPSATLWLEWKSQRPAPARTPALALADPPPPGSGGGRPVVMAASERAAVFADAVQLGALPYARQESRAVVKALGGGSVRKLGDDASEEFLKQTELSRFRLLHFATHAVLDEQNPERSGVLLAPAGDEDGLLQIREIVDLDLDGRIVVLASCRSASGTLLRGEGVMGMARAFFQAGSHAVVASLWPLRDDDAAALFDRFYQHLGRGASLSEALRAAQRERIEAGAPAEAWAGLIVLGDGDLVPVPGGRKDPAFGGRELAVGLIAVLLGLGWAWLWRARSREQRRGERRAVAPLSRGGGGGWRERGRG